MRIGLFDDYRPGIVKDDQIVDFGQVLSQPIPENPQDLIRLIIENWDNISGEVQSYVKKQNGVPLSSVKIRSPLPRPNKIICMAVNYLEAENQEMPAIDAFLKDSDCVVGDWDTVYLDPKCEARIFHHEAELAVVIGKTAANVDEDSAMDYVFGYTGFMDVSGRITVRNSQSYFQAKSWRTFGPTGPFIVTKDEVPDPHNLWVSLSNNDVKFPGYSTGDMAHKIPECIAFSSRILQLSAGDIISTGTNHQNLGAMQDGDKIVIDIEKIGPLHVNVHDPLKREWPRGLDEAMAQRMRGA